MHRFPHELIDAVAAFLSALVPAAIGAAIAVTFERGLSWGQRFLQVIVGICVSYFMTGFAAWMMPWPMDDFALNAVGFVFGLIGFKATPQLIAGAADAARRLPNAVTDRLIGLLPKSRKDD